MLELCQSVSSIYNIRCRFALDTSFLLEIVIMTGRPWILDTNRANSSIYIAFGAVVAVQVFLSTSF